MADHPPGWEPVQAKPPGWEAPPQTGEIRQEPPTNLIAQLRSRLLPREHEIGPHGAPTSLERGVKTLIPGSWPGLVATGASFIPGAGLPGVLGRVAAATGGAGAIEAVRGGEPRKGMLEAGGGTLFGEALGGLGRAGARYVGSKFDPIAANVAKVVGDLVPAFKGLTPRSTFVKAMGTEGQAALGQEYGNAVNTAIAQAGDPIVTVPGFSGPASRVWNLLKSEKRRLLKADREPTKTEGVFQRLDDVHEAEDTFAKQIEARLMGVQSEKPTSPVTNSIWARLHPEAAARQESTAPVPIRADAAGLFARANAEYRKGREVQRLFTGGQEKMTPSKVDEIVKPGPRFQIDQPTLATNLSLRAGKLREALGEDGYQQLVRAIQRGSEPGTRDIPGVAPHVRMFMGMLPSVHGLPHAPQLVGRPENRAKVISDWLRRLGVRGAGSQLEPDTPEGQR